MNRNAGLITVAIRCNWPVVHIHSVDTGECPIGPIRLKYIRYATN